MGAVASAPHNRGQERLGQGRRRRSEPPLLALKLSQVRCKRAMTFPERMRYGVGFQEGAVSLLLANSPPVITCFRRFLEAHGSERATAAGEASRHAHAA